MIDGLKLQKNKNIKITHSEKNLDHSKVIDSCENIFVIEIADVDRDLDLQHITRRIKQVRP